MKIPKEIAQEIITGSMKNIWDTFINLEGDYEDFEKDYQKAKYGLDVKFPIYWLWKDTNKILLKHKDNQVVIDGLAYFEDSFEIEKENRRKLMISAIQSNINEMDVISPRGRE